MGGAGIATVSPYRFAPGPAHARRAMETYAAMFDDGPVLDVGAGRGYFLLALRARGLAGVGIDTSAESISEAERLGVQVLREDAFAFLAEQSGLAGIFISHLIEHLQPSQVALLLEAAQGALRPGGQIVVVTPNPSDWRTLSEVFWLDPTHVRPYPRLLLEAMLESAGFVVDASGLGRTALGRRRVPATILNRLRFGSDYGRGEYWVRAHRARTPD